MRLFTNLLFILLLGFTFLVAQGVIATSAYAQTTGTNPAEEEEEEEEEEPECIGCSSCIETNSAQTLAAITANHNSFIALLGTAEPLPNGTGRLGQHQRWLVEYLFFGQGSGSSRTGGIAELVMRLAIQMDAVAMQQTQIIGQFFDAKHQMESQRIFEEAAARAMRRYHPSTGMCVIGTNVRSLASSDRYGAVTATILNRKMIDRQIGAANSASSDGPRADFVSRARIFREHYCSRYENNYIQLVANSGLTVICATAPKNVVNIDIDYTRLVDTRPVIRLDFMKDAVAWNAAVPGQDNNGNPHHFVRSAERDIIALSSHLYGSQVFPRMTDYETTVLANQSLLADTRAVITKRSAIQNTFNSIVGMRAMGSPNEPVNSQELNGSVDTALYMNHILYELGYPAVAKENSPGNPQNSYEESQDFIDYYGFFTDGMKYSTDNSGNVTLETIALRPSYYSQMEVLTKKMLQSPSFYTSLQESRTNVQRRSAALQALGLMLDRDLIESYHRNEILMSLLLETRLMKTQREVMNRAMGAVSRESE
jgi:hypothetical protein